MESAAVNAVPNTIVITEKRNVINSFRNWYKEKIIDTGISQKFEEGLINYHRCQEKALDAFGKIAVVVLAVCPADGPMGEAITIAAKPFISKLVKLQNNMTEKGIISAKRSFEAHFINADGSSEKVVLPEMKLDQIVFETKNLIGEFSELEKDSSRGVSR